MGSTCSRNGFTKDTNIVWKDVHLAEATYRSRARQHTPTSVSKHGLESWSKIAHPSRPPPFRRRADRRALNRTPTHHYVLHTTPLARFTTPQHTLAHPINSQRLRLSKPPAQYLDPAEGLASATCALTPQTNPSCSPHER